MFQTDRLLLVIESSYWYLLPISHQRLILLMIARAQNPTVLKAGTVPLNMNLFAKVCFFLFKCRFKLYLNFSKVMNTVYKFFMVLNEIDLKIE